MSIWNRFSSQNVSRYPEAKTTLRMAGGGVNQTVRGEERGAFWWQRLEAVFLPALSSHRGLRGMAEQEWSSLEDR